jgi:molecular chaperone GrpE
VTDDHDEGQEPTPTEPTNPPEPESESDSEADEEPLAVVSVEELIQTVETVTAERDTHLADLQRVSAEFANFRKQNEKRQADVVHQAASRLAVELLPVLDAFDAAVAQGVEGIDHVRDQLLAVLTKEGLEKIAEVGEAFDPNRHEAAMTEPAAEGDPGPVVGQVLRTGYGWNGRVLRAAMVAVRG